MRKNMKIVREAIVFKKRFSRKRKEFSRIRRDISRDKDTSNVPPYSHRSWKTFSGSVSTLGFLATFRATIDATTAAKQEKLLDGNHAYRSSLNHAYPAVQTYDHHASSVRHKKLSNLDLNREILKVNHEFI